MGTGKQNILLLKCCIKSRFCILNGFHRVKFSFSYPSTVIYAKKQWHAGAATYWRAECADYTHLFPALL